LVRDAGFDGGANNDFIMTAIAGVPVAYRQPGDKEADPRVPPPVPANALALYEVTVPGGAANLDTAAFSDVRPGALAVANQIPAGEAHATSGATVAGGTMTVLQASRYTTGGMTHISTGVAAQSGLQVPVGGMYAVAGQLKLVAWATALTLEVGIGVNNAVVLRGMQSPPVTSQYLGCTVAGMVECLAGDLLALWFSTGVATVPFSTDGGGSGQTCYLTAHLVSKD
jgi:hypothetical protein